MENEEFLSHFSIQLPTYIDSRNIIISENKINENKENIDLPNFKTTLFLTYHRLTMKYNTSKILLTASEFFSLCIGLKYFSEKRGINIIGSTPIYFNRISKILNKYFLKSENRYYLEEFFLKNKKIK